MVTLATAAARWPGEFLPRGELVQVYEHVGACSHREARLLNRQLESRSLCSSDPQGSDGNGFRIAVGQE